MYRTVTGLYGWREQASCVGIPVEMFYPEIHTNISPLVQKVCAACPVRVECLKEGFAVSEGFGAWGGFSADAREKMRKP